MARVIGIGDNVVDCNYSTGMAYPGGNSVNFAVFAKQLGHESAYLGRVANDSFGLELLETLKTLGVDVSRCEPEAGETGRSGIYLTEGDRRIVEENDGGIVKSQPLVLTEELMNYAAGFELVHTANLGYIDQELGKLRRAGIPVLYDFSDAWDEQELQRVCPEITFAFLSGKELGEEELQETLRQCVDQWGCRLACTTMGKRGAIVYNGRHFYMNHPYNVKEEVTDTTGAGDSWITAFITEYLDGMRFYNTLQEGAPEHFLGSEDLKDYEDHLLQWCMCLGNTLARRNCLVSGAFGNGKRFSF